MQGLEEENPFDDYDTPDGAGASHTASRNGESDPHSIGISTVKLRVSAFEVAKDTDLDLQKSSRKGTGKTSEAVLFHIGGDGRVVTGRRARANIGPIFVTISGPDAMDVEVTMPQLLYDDNRTPIDTSLHFEMAVKVLYERLRKFGITASLPDAQVRRLDIYCNVESDGRLPAYEVVLERCGLPHMECRHYDDGSYQFKNGEREVRVYPKGPKHRDNEHTQRFEYRLRCARSIRRHAGIEFLSDIQQNFEKVRGVFRAAMSQFFPKIIEVQDQFVYSLREAVARAIEELEVRTKVPHSRTLQALGARCLREYDATDEFLSAVRDSAGRRAENRYRQKLDDLSPIVDLISSRERTAIDMLEELLYSLQLSDKIEPITTKERAVPDG